MRSEVLQLFCEEYGVSEESFGPVFDAMYNHPIQRNKCIRIVAIENGEIAGFQSYMYWPYSGPNGAGYNSFQSGNSIVGRNHRGKGVFTKLLKALNPHDFEFDFIVGFPVEQSYGAFLKCGWKSPFRLNWAVKVHKPLSSLIRQPQIRESIGWPPLPIAFSNGNQAMIELSGNPDFDNYRSSLRPGHHIRLPFFAEGQKWLVSAKLLTRGKLISEVIIGKIRGESTQSFPSKRVISEATKLISKNYRCTIISFAYPSNLHVDLPKGFFTTSREIRFVFLPGSISLEELMKFPFNVGRADIDTW